MRPYMAQILSVIWDLTPLVLVVLLYWQGWPAAAHAVAAVAATRAPCRRRASGASEIRRRQVWVETGALSATYLAAAVGLCLLGHPEAATVVVDMGRRVVARHFSCGCTRRCR